MLSDDVETAQTVSMMDRLAAEDAGHRFVIDAVNEALEDAALELNSAPIAKACAIFWWLKKHIIYEPTPGTSPLVDQTLIPPVTLLSMLTPTGDCPQFSMLASAMMRVCCIPSYFKTIAADAEYPDTYSHIYNVAQLAPRSFLPFDSSNGPEPGAEFAHPLKARVWPQLTKDRCKENMLRSERRPAGYRNALMRGALRDGHLYQTLNGLHRLGQDDSGYDIYSQAGVDPTYTGTQNETVTYGGDSSTPPSSLVNFGSNTTLAPTVAAGTAGTGYGLAASALADASALAAPIVKAATQQQPYYITNPATGQSVLYNPNTGTTAGGISAALSSLSPTMILIGVGLVALVAFAGKGK
jgi:hypothetical protein